MERYGITVLYRTFRIMGQGVYLCGKDNFKEDPKGNQISAACEGDGMKVPKSQGYDPKPGDLTYGRVKRT